jgi:methyltransferase (TIGR00027 family)
MGDYTAARTKLFDDFFAAASIGEIDQVVILAAGLDARAWRLDFAPTTTVYEIDRDEVLEFKTRTLARHGFPPATHYVHVGVDLRQERLSALRNSGFDESKHTAWSVEGLLPYLPASGPDRLFEFINRLGAPASRIAVEAFGDDFYDLESVTKRAAGVSVLREAAKKVGSEVADTNELFFIESRSEVAGCLAQHGWDTTSIDALELMARYDPAAPERTRDSVVKSVFVEAVRIR